MSSRVLAVSAAAAALCAGSIVDVTPAFAHVHASSPGAVRGGFSIVTFEVPNESESGSATNELTVILPDVASARTEAKPGWTARLDRDAAAGSVRSVTWTAAANPGIGADEFGLFRISLKLPDTDTVRFPAAQHYADGTVVRWDQTPLPDGGEPDRPVPALHLAAGPPAAREHHAPQQHPALSASASPDPAGAEGADEVPGNRADNPARLLAGVALLIAALGVTVAITRRRT